MNNMYHNEEEQSYFPPQPPVLQALPSSDTLSSDPTDSFPLLNRPVGRRPQTPLFPNIPPQNEPITNGKHLPRQNPKEKLHRHPHVHLLSREQDENRPRSRSRSDGSGANTLSAILRLLALETARADTAERALTRDADALLARVRAAKEAKESSETELARVRQELGLYKLQLEAAQREIDRAQVIVADVERARVEAEDRAVKDRDRIRKLVTQRAVEIAREEGRREGWKQGLERGRWVARADVEGSRRAMVEYEEDDQDDSRSPSEESLVSRIQLPSPTRTRGSEWSDRRGSTRARDMTDVDVPHAPNATTPTLATPIPRHPILFQSRRSTSQRPAPSPFPVSTPARSPENISIQSHPRSQTQTRGRSGSDPRAPSPTLTQTSRSPSLAPSRRSNRSRNLPPDGYIPTLGPDSLISLPPPHELSQPVDFGGAGTDTRSITGIETGRNGTEEELQSRRKSQSRDQNEERNHQKPPKARDYGYRSTSGAWGGRVPEYDDVFRERRGGGRTPAMSTISRGSTRISQYDLVSPPRDRDRERDWIRRRNYGSGMEGDESRKGKGRDMEPQVNVSERRPTQPEQIVEEWRSANSAMGTPMPLTHAPSRKASAAGSIYSTAGIPSAGANPIEGPTRSPHVNRGPRPIQTRGGQSPTRISSPNFGPRFNIYQTGRNNDPHHASDQFHEVSQARPAVPFQYREEHGLSPGRPSDTFQRSVSNTTVVGISIEPPSHSPTNSSEGTIVDPILLTPDHANRPTPLPGDMTSQPQGIEPSRGPDQPIHVVWPDKNFPLGFVPLSPIPTLTNFNPDDHDHRRMHEQFSGSGYQIYAGAALMPHPRGTRARTGPSGSTSVLFAEPPRPSTAAGLPSSPYRSGSPRRRVLSFGVSPAPLDRPLSIFSDT